MFTFDPDTHYYELDGKELPSVTTILKDAGIIDTSKYATGSAEFGSDVHAACELYDLYGEESADERVKGHLIAWKAFLDRLKPKFTHCEEPIYHQTHIYAGTPDRVGSLNAHNRTAIIDIKSGHKEPWHALQSAAYAWCFEKPTLIERMCVYLRSDGTHSVEYHQRTRLQEDITVFLAALSLRNWRLKHGK